MADGEMSDGARCISTGKTFGGRLYSTGRKAPAATDNPMTAPDAYQEFNVILFAAGRVLRSRQDSG